MNLIRSGRRLLLLSLAVGAALLSGAASTALAICGPFTDISDGGFCPFVLDGQRIWTANLGSPGSVSFVTPTAAISWTVTTVTGFIEAAGILYDGGKIWVTDLTANTLLKLDSNAAVLQTVTVGSGPKFPIYDGTNIWVPNIFAASVTVVRASNGAILATLTGNGLSFPNGAAFDGQRVLVTNGTDSVSLWKAADLTPMGSVFTGTSSDPVGACSDGISFWIGLSSPSRLARF